jgi:hypothetical protein
MAGAAGRWRSTRVGIVADPAALLDSRRESEEQAMKFTDAAE